MDMTTTEEMPPVALNSNKTLFLCTDDSRKYENILNYLNLFGSLALLIIGTGGNVVTYSVFKQRAYRRNVMASMFRYLSVLDSIFLWTVVLQVFIKGVTGYHVTNTTNRGCLFVVFWQQVLLSLSNWLLVVITVARLVHLKYPLKSQTICSKLNYNLLLVVTHVFVIGVFTYSILLTHSRLSEADYNSGKNCFYHISRTDVHGLSEKILYCVANFLGPAVLLVFCNIAIVFEMRAVKKRRHRLFNRPISSSLQYKSTEQSEDPTTRDKSQNAIRFDEIQSQLLTTPNSRACNGSSTNGAHCSELAVQGHGKGCDDRDTLPSLPPVSALVAHRCWRLNEKKTNSPGHGSAVQHSAFSCSALSKRNDLSMDFNWSNSDASVPAIQLSSVDPVMVRRNTNLHIVEDSHQYLGASLAVGSEVTSRSSRSQATSSGKQLSIRSWISDLRSHGVDMECEEEQNPKVNGQEDTTAVKEQDGEMVTSGVKNLKRYDRSYTLTLMLLAASSIFLVLNTPFWLIHFGWIKSITHNPSIGCSLRYMILDIVFFLGYLNNTLNFVFYCAIGSRFRRDVFAWFHKFYL